MPSDFPQLQLRTIFLEDGDDVKCDPVLHELICRSISSSIWEGYNSASDICDTLGLAPLMPLTYLSHIASSN